MGSWYDQEPGSHPGFLYQQNSLRDAQVAALTLNIFHRHTDRVKLTAIAQMVNVLQAMILTDGPKMVLTPTYHVYDLYVPFQGATLVPASFDGGSFTASGATMPRVDAVAARDSNGKYWIALTNVDPNNPAEIAAEMGGLRIRSASGRVLTAAKVDSVNSFDAPNAVAPKPISARVSGKGLTVKLPPKSVAVLAVEAAR